MVAGFRQFISFPNQNPRPSEKSFHVRSTSLPSRSYPVTSHLKDELDKLRTWESKADIPTSAWICDGLSMLKSLQETLDDIFSSFLRLGSHYANDPTWLGWSTLSKKGRRIGGIEEFREVGMDSLSGLKKKAEEELRKTSRKLQTLEDCVSEIESGNERVFRSLINTRVSLLNSLTL